MTTTINGSAGVTTNSGAVYDGLQSQTAKTATGTAVDFTDIPSWVKRITVMFSGVSTNGSSSHLIQLGISTGVISTGYVCSKFGVSTSTGFVQSATNGFIIGSANAAELTNGSYIISNITANSWVVSGTSSSSTTVATGSGGSVTLSGALDRIRITTVNGTDTFDAGTINIIYE